MSMGINVRVQIHPHCNTMATYSCHCHRNKDVHRVLGDYGGHVSLIFVFLPTILAKCLETRKVCNTKY